MARYSGPSCRLCRREGEKLYLKGIKCQMEKCAVNQRAYAPGQHGAMQQRRKASNYGLQLREKQKAKRIYGVLERQFRRYFKIADRSKEVTGVRLLQFLEMRLDNIAYSLCLAASRAQGRQLVRHGFVYVNGRKVTIPSYQVKVGDEIQVRTSDEGLKRIKEILEQVQDRGVPSWLKLTADDLSGGVLRMPMREDIQQPIQEALIVELYSK
ncbi:MAG: 30S ribosomal protein S4 [Candidatus Omnitrophica bacterium]|nr:30S ribosomal protein S4 [Candidatus Omnitrophota bacterium]